MGQKTQDNPEITNCAERNDCEGILRCLSSGESVDLPRDDGRTAFLVACFNGNIDAAKLLLEKGANLYAKNRKGANAFSHAAYRNHLDVVVMLAEKGIDANEVDTKGRNSLHMSCSQGCNETVKYLLQNKLISDINAKTKDGRDALLLSIEGNCSPSTVLELLVHGANVNTTTKEGRTVLMESIRLERSGLFHIFYRYSNININRIDTAGNCCMHYACFAGNLRIIKSLLHRGAFVRVQNKKGEFPLDFAEANNHDDCVSLLEAVSSPPQPSSPSVVRASKTDMIATWTDPRPTNYYPQITAVEIQLKQHRLFDPWKTLQVLKVSDTPFKENPSTINTYFEDSELTDIDSDDDKEERKELELACAYMQDHESILHDREEQIERVDVLSRRYILPPLSENQKYQLRVRFANKYGWGEFSSPCTFCPKDVIDTYQEETQSHPKRHSLCESSIKRERKVSQPLGIDEATIEGLTQALEKQRQSDSQDVSTQLNRIVENGLINLKESLENGLDISNLRNKSGMTLLHVAAASSNDYAEPIIQFVLENQLLSVNEKSKNGWTPLHYAVAHQNESIVKLLLNAGSDVNVADNNGFTPFLIAADRGNLSILQDLLPRLSSSDITVTDQRGRNALVIAVQGGHMAIVQWLLLHGYKSDYEMMPMGYNLLHLAVLTNQEQMTKFCLDLGISPTSETADGLTALDLAEEKANESIVALLKRYAGVPGPIVKSTVEVFATEAEVAVQLSPPLDNQVLMIIKRVEVSYKKSSLLAASTTVSLDLNETPAQNTVTLKLPDLSPDTSYKYRIRCQNSNGYSDWSQMLDFQTIHESEIEPMTVQSRGKDQVCMDYENRMKCWTEKRLNGLKGELLQAAIQEDPESILTTLLEITDEEGLQLIESLIEINYDWNQIYSIGLFDRITLIDCICMRSTTVLLHSLLNHHQSISTHCIHQYTACYYYSLYSKSIDILKELHSLSISLTTPNNQTLLHMIAAYCHSPAVHDFITYALSLGLDLNAQDGEGNTPLHVAVLHGNTLTLPVLMSYSCSLTIRNHQSLTPLTLAERIGDPSLLQILVNSYRVPGAPSTPQCFTQNRSTMLLRWNSLGQMNGIPMIDHYEVVIHNSLLNMELKLPDTIPTDYALLSIPLFMHQWITFRVRAHNVNGWSEWSNMGLFEVKNEEPTNDLYQWLFSHSCEDCYETLSAHGISTLAKLSELDPVQLKNMSLNSFKLPFLIHLLPEAKAIVLTGSKPVVYSWFKD